MQLSSLKNTACRAAGFSVMNAITFISPPHEGHSSRV